MKRKTRTEKTRNGTSSRTRRNHSPGTHASTRSTTAGRRTIIIGDLHGDPEALAAILEHARLATSGAWTGGAARLIQLGDCVDRGPDSVGVLDLLATVQQSAAAGGGEVVRLAGNHEMELMRGCVNYAQNLPDPLRVGERLCREVAAGQIICAARVGAWLCLHGGLRPELRHQLAREAQSRGHGTGLTGVVERMNDLFARAAKDGDFGHALFDDRRGAFWTYREELLRAPGALEVPQIVGHTVCPSPFIAGHRALFADQGISVAMWNRPSYLEFDGPRLRWHVRGSDGVWRTETRDAAPGSLHVDRRPAWSSVA